MARRRFSNATHVKDPYLGFEHVVKKCPVCGEEFGNVAGVTERYAVMNYDDHYEQEHVTSARGRITLEMDAPTIGRAGDEKEVKEMLRRVFEHEHGGSDVEVLDIEIVEVPD